MLNSRSLLAGTCCLAFLLTGCGEKEDDTSTDSVSEQAASASQSLGMLLDVSTEAVLNGTSGGDSDRAIGDPLAEPMPDLTARATSSSTVDLAFATVNGQRIFPSGTASGTITVVTTGTAATSWPAGTTTLFDGSVTVTISNVLFTNGNGDSLSIPSGSFSYTLTAQGTKTDIYNWTISTVATTALTTPLTATLIHGGTSHTVTLAGNRRVDQQLDRVYTTDSGTGAVTANTRTASRTVSGSVPGTTFSSDPTFSAKDYTSWAVTIDGSKVEWNRNASITTKWDYRQLGTGNAFTVTSAHDYTYLATTINGTLSRIGPFTAGQMAALLRARIEAAWL